MKIMTGVLVMLILVTSCTSQSLQHTIDAVENGIEDIYTFKDSRVELEIEDIWVGGEPPKPAPYIILPEAVGMSVRVDKNLSRKVPAEFYSMEDNSLEMSRRYQFAITIKFSNKRSNVDEDIVEKQTRFEKKHPELFEIVEAKMESRIPNSTKYWVSYSMPQYVYAPLKSLEITCNQTVWGVEPGGNIVDKFCVEEIAPAFLFSYPRGKYRGDLRENSKYYLDNLSSCLTPHVIQLHPLAPYEENLSKDVVTFTVRVVLGKSYEFVGKATLL